MKTFATIHAVAQNDKGEILVLQRAAKRDRPGKWNCITGFIQERESAEDAAVRELMEETNLRGKLLRTGEPHWTVHDDDRWMIVPSLIHVSDVSALRIDKHESQAYRWIKVDDPDLISMPSLKQSLSLLGL